LAFLPLRCICAPLQLSLLLFFFWLLLLPLLLLLLGFLLLLQLMLSLFFLSSSLLLMLLLLQRQLLLALLLLLLLLLRQLLGEERRSIRGRRHGSRLGSGRGRAHSGSCCRLASASAALVGRIQYAGRRPHGRVNTVVVAAVVVVLIAAAVFVVVICTAELFAPRAAPFGFCIATVAATATATATAGFGCRWQTVFGELLQRQVGRARPQQMRGVCVCKPIAPDRKRGRQRGRRRRGRCRRRRRRAQRRAEDVFEVTPHLLNSLAVLSLAPREQDLPLPREGIR
jgi:hypothetical protein